MARCFSAGCLLSTTHCLLSVWVCYLLCTAQLCTPTAAAHQHGKHGRHSRQLTATSSKSSCKTRKGVAMLTLAYLGRNENRQRSYLYWLSIASKRLYAHAWNYPLYVVAHRLQPHKHPAWEKLIAVEAVMRHSCVEWVWVTDGDAWNMDLHLDIQDVINDELQKSKQQGGNKSVDVMYTRDCNTINTGSILFRHSDWTLQHLADIWFSDAKSIDNIDYWWENAAIIHLAKHPQVQPHYHQVPQVRINAYGPETNCSDGSGTFKKGTSLLYHAPGGYKYVLSAEHENLLPVLQASNVAIINKNRDAQVYAVYAHAHPPQAKGGRSFQFLNVTTMHVRFEKSAVAGPSEGEAAPISFELDIALKPAHAVNPGWPVIIPAFLRHMIGAVLGVGQREYQNQQQHAPDT